MQKSKKDNILECFVQKEAIETFNASPKSINWSKTAGSGLSLSLMALHQKAKLPLLFIAQKALSAQKILDEIDAFLGKEAAMYFPETTLQPYQVEETDNANQVLRNKAIRAIDSSFDKIIVSTSIALSEKVPSKTEVKKKSLQISVGMEIGHEQLNEKLFALDFQRVDFVSQPGEFALRGHLLDVFSSGDENPFRIVFFDKEVEKIKSFGLEDQLSLESFDAIEVYAPQSSVEFTGNRISFLELIPKQTHIIVEGHEEYLAPVKAQFEKSQKIFETKDKQVISLATPSELFLDQNRFEESLQKFSLTYSILNENANSLSQEWQPAFGKKFDLLKYELENYQNKGYQSFIACPSEKQANRLYEILHDEEKTLFTPLYKEVHHGFIDHELKLLVFTHHEIFERFHKSKNRTAFIKKEQLTLKAISNLQMGDFVTHIDYGIGKFAGLKKIEVNGKHQEAIKLTYQNNDILYVNIHSLHKISKYSGGDGKEPKISKLGSPAWKKLKGKTRTKVKELAFDLIKLYAKRKAKKGFAYGPDSYLQQELEASFIYEDTPDQLSASEAVKSDMEIAKPMDRLICGDVGFGKTEIAIRAAFKAVDNGKQVAILVPTTILAFQHFHSFRERLKELQPRIDYLNRFRTAKEKREILEKVAQGKIDILIGTHQIIGKDIKFDDLGLLIVDEEHKFGVGVKEKLRNMRENLDTLTLTATPIPRTLQFSLMAARDLSVIKTPPPNRQPIQTELCRFGEEVIRDAVMTELERGGQVYLVHNRVENIKEVAGMVQRLVPDAKIGIGHGQMDGKQLEKIFLDFIAGRFDILVSTTIIESGLDVPNANTIIINDAHRFGLADLHQMRGRVGRSNKKAFCYLISPPLDAMNKEAATRLKALTQFSDLGSGFNIAMKDLEIRGSGNLLGPEQSGFISEMGFDAYQKVLFEAVDELKKDEFADLFETEENKTDFVKEVQLDTDFELLIPDHYVNSVEERMLLYQEINSIKDEEALSKFETKLEDRFGSLPLNVLQLLSGLSLKWKAQKLGFEKVVLQQGICLTYFVRNPDSDYFQSATFNTLLQFVQRNKDFCHLKERKSKEGKPYLTMRLDKISSMEKALSVFSAMEASLIPEKPQTQS